MAASLVPTVINPSESRPYKQYCTTVFILLKAEATLIGSCPQGVRGRSRARRETGGGPGTATGQRRKCVKGGAYHRLIGGEIQQV